MANKLMYIPNVHNIAPSLDYNQWLKLLNTQPNETAHQNSIKVSKIVKKTLLQTFGD